MAKFFITSLVILLCSCNPFSDTENISYTDSQGKVKVEGKKVAGKKEGVWSYYYTENGELFEEREYKNDVLHGAFKEYRNGRLLSEIHYELNANHGPYIRYNPDNGKPLIKGQYEKNKMVGVWYFYDSEGELTKKFYYENDNLVKSEDITKEAN